MDVADGTRGILDPEEGRRRPSVHLVAEPGRVAVHGIGLARSPHRLEDRGSAVGTKFRPGGFAGFTPLAQRALVGRTLPLGDALGPDGAALAGALERDADPDARIAAVEAFLVARLPDHDPRLALVGDAVALMLEVPAGTRVDAVARTLGVSGRTLQRLFRRYLGVGPKWVLQRYRLHEAAERMVAGETDDLTGLAVDLGYFDQAHFISDFHAFVGVTPAAYAAVVRAAAGAGTRP